MKKILTLVGIISLTVCNSFSQIQSGSIYKIVSKASSKVLNVSNSSIANGANVDTWTDTKSDAQRWIINAVGNNQYTLTNVGSGKMLHIANATPANSVNVDQRDNTNNNTVRWYIVSQGNGYFTVQSAANTGFVMDLSGAGTTDGTNVALWTANNGDNQAWAFQVQAARPATPTAAIADEIFSAWKVKYYDARTGNEVIPNEGFWGVAEMMEMVVDAYEVTGNAKYRTLFDEMYRLFLAKEGQDWMWNDYNDDITWMVLASVRAGMLTDNQAYINKAKEQFDKMYARAIRDNGNWLVWKQGVAGTNSCINGPAMVACMYLYQVTGDNNYVNKAVTLYNWSRNNLFEPATGKVYDNNNSGSINYWSSTYNQGTYLGASIMLYNHTKDASYLTIADKIAQYTKVNMYNSGVINNEEGPDLDGFKGIFARYARKYIVDGNRADYIPWLQLNAKVAYNNRNTENIIRTLWSTRTTQGTYYKAFNASTAVSLLVNCPYSTSTTRDAYSTIEAENFNYLKGVIVEPCPEGTSNIGGVQNGYYTGYNNVNFGNISPVSAELRVASAADAGTIEIRVGSPTGTLIGTATIPAGEGWSVYKTVTCNVSNITGVNNIYLVYKGSGYIVNLNNFRFISNTTTPPSPVIGTVYKNCNYDSIGYAAGLGVGEYTLAQLTAKGVLNNDISSVKIQSGYEMVLYTEDNFLGTSLVVRADNTCLVSNNFNDTASSLKIRLIPANQSSRLKASAEVDEIKVTPNPASEYIKINSSGSTKVSIYNLQGYKLVNEAVLGPEGILSINHLPAGVYTVQIQTNSTVRHQKIVKQ